MSLGIIIDTEDIDRLKQAIEKTGDVTKRVVSPAVKRAIRPTRMLVKSKAPKDTGALKKAIVIIKGEKSRAKAKKVYQIGVDPKKNDIFVKISKHKKRSYYPASQESGWKMRNGQKHEGLHYMREASDERAQAFSHEVVDNVLEGIEKAWKKKQAKQSTSGK